jgi:hypothetical protein
VKPLLAADFPVCTHTLEGEHWGAPGYALRKIMPSLASLSRFGILSTGILEFGIPSSIATGVPFQAQSSIKSNTMLGWELFSGVHEKKPVDIRTKATTLRKASFFISVFI